MAHQVFVGVAHEVIAIGPVATEIKAVEDPDKFRQFVDHSLAFAKAVVVVEVVIRALQPAHPVRRRQCADNLIETFTNVGLSVSRDHIGEGATFWHFDLSITLPGIFVGYIFHEQKGQDVVFVLRGVHAAAQLVATGPKSCIKFSFLDGHATTFFKNLSNHQ